MAYSRSFFCLILLVALCLPISPAFADTSTASLSAVNYDDVRNDVYQDVKHLQDLGGGIKPFESRLSEIDQMKTNGQADAAMNQLSFLSSSVKDQLKSLTDLRQRKAAPKPKVQAVAGGRFAGSGDGLLAMFANQKLDNINAAQAQQLQAMFIDSNFNGSGQEYIQKVAQDIIAREFGGLGIPCRGPFQLERFRNLHRMNEFRKQGRDIKNFLSYHNQTEQLAARASREPEVVAELSQRVRYLEQQMGMSPLTGSAQIRSY